MKKIWKIMTIGASLGSMTACSTVGMKSADADLDKKINQTNELMTKSGVMVKDGLIKKSSAFWVSKDPLPDAVDPSMTLPPFFRKEVVMNKPLQTMRLKDVLMSLERDYGLLFVVNQDVYDGDVKGQGTSTSSASAGGLNADSTNKVGSSSGSNKIAEVMLSDVSYKGSLVGLLDLIANKASLSWKFDGEKIYFFRYETRLFKIYAMSGASSTTSSVSAEAKTSSGGAGQTGASGTASSKNESSLKVNSDIWADIINSLQNQLTPGRGKMTAMGSTGHVAITDTPDQLKRIEQYIKDLNKNLGKQVAFNVNIYSVELNDSDAVGIDWGVVWQTMSSKYNVAVQTKNAAANIGNSFAVNFVNPANGSGNGNFTGSNALLAALSSVGKTTLVTSTNLVTLNNITVPLSVTNISSYLKSQSVTVTGTSGTAQTALNPEERSLGLGLSLEPKLTETDLLFLRVTMNLSSDGGLRTYVSPDGKSSLEMPNTGKTDSYQTVKMKSGETLILSGFQQVKTETKEQGIREASNWPLTGLKTTGKKVSTLVVLITPYVMEN